MSKLHTVRSWHQLLSFFETLPTADIVCRGQNKEYKDHQMKPRIDRCVNLTDLKSRLRRERAVCQRFRELAPIYLSDVERRYLETRWLALVVMQHYGVPTRLLDWTKSAWVAAYFASFGDWESDGYVYGFHRHSLEDSLRSQFRRELKQLVWGLHPGDKKFSDDPWDSAKVNDKLFFPNEAAKLSDWVATYYCRQPHFPRLIAQQGVFTFASKPDLDHWNQINKLLHDDCFVVEIKALAKAEILRGLNSIGLNGGTLFPGPDGIGRSLEGFARAWPLDR